MMWSADMLRKICCPMCKSSELMLENGGTLLNGISGSAGIRCKICGRTYAYERGILDMRPDSLRFGNVDPGWERWQGHQSEYQDREQTLWNKERAERGKKLYDRFFEFADIEQGCVLDVGGWRGISRHWVRDVRYVVVDPYRECAVVRQDFMSDLYPCLLQPMPFLWGVGEFLPVISCCFDYVLNMSTLDHVLSPYTVLVESWRVLKDRGSLLLFVQTKKSRVVQASSHRSKSWILQEMITRGQFREIIRTFGRIAKKAFAWTGRATFIKGVVDTMTSQDHHMHQFSRVDLEQLLEAANFHIIQSEYHESLKVFFAKCCKKRIMYR